MRRLLLLGALALVATTASAQLPGLRTRGPAPPAPVLLGIDALRADFIARTGRGKV